MQLLLSTEVGSSLDLSLQTSYATSIMKTLTINLTDEAYQAIREALQKNLQCTATVTGWLEMELNENTEAVIEMLLGDF